VNYHNAVVSFFTAYNHNKSSLHSFTHYHYNENNTYFKGENFMLDIIFQNSKYSFDNSALNLQYFNSGDLHGNDNFRTQNKSLSVYEILQQINPDLLYSALAAKLNGIPVPLTAKVTNNCTLDIITINEPQGKSIYYNSLAFLVAQAVYELEPEIQLATISTSKTHCSLQFIINNVFAHDTDSVDKQLAQVIETNVAIQLIDAFQKEILLETYPSLSQPYAETILAQYDDYDFVPVAVHQNFVLPVLHNAILVTNPKQLTGFSISHTIANNIYTITLQLN